MIIIGAGLAGLLCGALNPGSVIYEAGPERGMGHKALFRCRSGEIGRILGVPFKEVTVHKAIWFNHKEVEPTPRIAHMYSKKVTGTITARSIFDTTSAKRYVPPPYFYKKLVERCKIEYNKKVDYKLMTHMAETVVSTIPMYEFSGESVLLNDEKFSYTPIYVTRLKMRNCDSHCTMYYPSSDTPVYRSSIMGDRMIIESIAEMDNEDISSCLISMGLLVTDIDKIEVENYCQRLGKISPINEERRKQFINVMTLNYNVYSLGRFATWRPKVMMDDVLEDIFVIRRLIEGGNYASLHHNQGE